MFMPYPRAAKEMLERRRQFMEAMLSGGHGYAAAAQAADAEFPPGEIRRLEKRDAELAEQVRKSDVVGARIIFVGVGALALGAFGVIFFALVLT